MEIKRKKIKAEEIYIAEQKSAEQIKMIFENKKSAFEALGYELTLEFVQKENERQSRFEVFSSEESKKFEAGYISRATITVKRPKTEEELAQDQRLLDETKAIIGNCGESETDSAEGEDFQTAEDTTKRTVAFTGVMLVRVYKSFWTEWVCLGEETARLEADLDEFLDALEQKQRENS